MQIINLGTGRAVDIVIEPVADDDYKRITKSRYYFDWKAEREYHVFKLQLSESDEILGLMSLKAFHAEERIEITLLSVSKENRGKLKQYDGIAGNLIAWACRETLKLYGIEGCVSLRPKTVLKQHYIEKYGMEDAGFQIFLEGKSLLELLKKYKV